MLTSYCCMRSSITYSSEHMFGVDGLRRFMVRMHFHVPSIGVLVESRRFMIRMHFHVPSIDVLVESLKHDAQHFAFNVGVATFCFSQ